LNPVEMESFSSWPEKTEKGKGIMLMPFIEEKRWETATAGLTNVKSTGRGPFFFIILDARRRAVWRSITYIKPGRDDRRAYHGIGRRWRARPAPQWGKGMGEKESILR